MSRVPLSAACCLALAACGGSPTSNLVPPPPPPPNAVATVTINQAPQNAIEAGTAVQLSAEARNASGALVTGQFFSWSSSAPAVATVSSTGRVTAVAQGSATITVTTAGISASATITVIPQVVTSVAVFPATLAVSPGGSGQFNASALGNSGTIAGYPIQWSSSDPTVATVDGSGRVTGVAEGTALVTARAGGVERSRGVTVSTATLNFWVYRADFIQVAQTATGSVPVVKGKPAAIRVYPAGTQPGWDNIPIEVTLSRGGAVVFSTTVSSGIVSVVPSASDPQQGVIVPLPPGLDVDGTVLRATIDPNNSWAERDEWDNAAPAPGDDATPIAAVTVPTLRIRLVPLAPAGSAPPTIFSTTVDAVAEFMRTVYPATNIEITIRSAGIVTPFAWPDRSALSDALAAVEVERIADAFDGHYYGVHDQPPVSGIVGLGYLTARSSLGTANGVVFAHEVGHNMGLGHPPGCGADGANASYPYPNGQIGIRGYDARTQTVVPATAIDMMGYCGGTKWISGGYFSGILAVLRNRPPGTLRAAPGDEVPFAIQARWDQHGVARASARRLATASSRSEVGGAVAVQAVAADGQVLVVTSLPLLEVADVSDAALRTAGVISVPVDVASRVTAFWLTARGGRIVIPVMQ